MTVGEYVAYWQENFDRHQSRPSTYAAHGYFYKNHSKRSFSERKRERSPAHGKMCSGYYKGRMEKRCSTPTASCTWMMQCKISETWSSMLFVILDLIQMCFFRWFILSGIASKFEKGNPKYIAGMSGFELAEVVLSETNVANKKREPSNAEFKGREYWAGWILAYYQRKTGKRFANIVKDGLTLSTVFSMYILHEADES